MIGVLGAGLAGLSASLHLKREHLVFEKESEPGGLCNSKLVNGYQFDYGPHIFFTRDEYVTKLITEKINSQGNKMITKGRKAFIFFDGKYVEYPFEANLKPLSDSIKRECIDGLKSRSSKQPSNFMEWIDVTFGSGIARHYMVPYNEKVWKYPLEKMDIKWIAGRVPAPDVKEIEAGAYGEQKKSFGPNAVFSYPLSGGMGAIAKVFPSDKVKTSSAVEEVKTTSDGVSVLSGGKTYKFEKVISTLPLPEIVRMMDAPSEVALAAGKLIYNSLFCVNIGVKRQAISDLHWVYFPQKKFIFNRISFPMNFSPETVPKGRSSILTEVTFRGKREGEDFYKAEVIRGLTEAGILSGKDELEVVDTAWFKYAYVVYDLDHEENVKKIHRFLRENSIIPAGRFGEWEYINMDKSILSGKKAAGEVG